jgi:hypothetical protein
MSSDRDGPRITILDDSSGDDGEVRFVSASSNSPAAQHQGHAHPSTLELEQSVAVLVQPWPSDELVHFKAVPGENTVVRVVKEYKFKRELSYRVKFRDGHSEKVRRKCPHIS